MKIGMIAYSTNTGLGIQTLNFYNHMKPEKTLLVDLHKFNRMKTHHERYNAGEVMLTRNLPDAEHFEWLTDNVDIVFICETPLNYALMEIAKAKGVKVVLQYNYEFLDYLQTEKPAPDVLAAPSSWHKKDVESLGIAPVLDLPVPTDASNINYREISQCRTISHVAGKQAIHDRNGTMTFVQAAVKCGNKFKYKIFAQELDSQTSRMIEEAQTKIDIELVMNIPVYSDIYKDGDVMVIPRRYGGLCLPMQEALTAGMPVIMPDIEPNNNVLPKQWLVGGVKRTHSFMTRTQIDVYETSSDWLAMKMCEFADSEFMQWSNKEAIQIGKGLSWESMKPYYQTVFEQILAQ